MHQSRLLEQIQKKKMCLRPQETVVTSTNGERFIEKRSDNGVQITELKQSTFGFVVDEKPDLQIAEILPYLLLSSQDVTQNSDLLIRNNITHVLSIGIDIPCCMHLPDIIYKKINLLDLPESNILSVLEECFEFIEEAQMKHKESKILVHCNAGYSRSPSIIIAYLMKRFGYSLKKSIQIVKEKRNICPNDGFMNQLRLFEGQLIQQEIIQKTL